MYFWLRSKKSPAFTVAGIAFAVTALPVAILMAMQVAWPPMGHLLLANATAAAVLGTEAILKARRAWAFVGVGAPLVAGFIYLHLYQDRWLGLVMSSDLRVVVAAVWSAWVLSFLVMAVWFFVCGQIIWSFAAGVAGVIAHVTASRRGRR